MLEAATSAQIWVHDLFDFTTKMIPSASGFVSKFLCANYYAAIDAYAINLSDNIQRWVLTENQRIYDSLISANLTDEKRVDFKHIIIGMVNEQKDCFSKSEKPQRHVNDSHEARSSSSIFDGIKNWVSLYFQFFFFICVNFSLFFTTMLYLFGMARLVALAV